MFDSLPPFQSLRKPTQMALFFSRHDIQAPGPRTRDYSVHTASFYSRLSSTSCILVQRRKALNSPPLMSCHLRDDLFPALGLFIYFHTQSFLFFPVSSIFALPSNLPPYGSEASSMAFSCEGSPPRMQPNRPFSFFRFRGRYIL